MSDFRFNLNVNIDSLWINYACCGFTNGFSLALTACSSSGGGGTTELPAASGPIADLVTGTEMPVRGNHTGWWTTNLNCSAVPTPVKCPNEFAPNQNGPKLQRLDVEDGTNQYVAVFRNNLVDPVKDYGKAVFTMPEPGGVASGTTDLDYKFTIINNDDQLIYALTGLFKIANNPVVDPNRFAYGGYVAGSQTPTSELPTTGVVEYNGTFIGQSSIAGQVTGTVFLSANFGLNTDEIYGTITNINSGSVAIINNLTITATIDPLGDGVGSYIGVATATGAATGSDADLSYNSNGPVDGGFYGPGGIETGGTLRVVDGENILTGAFAAD